MIPVNGSISIKYNKVEMETYRASFSWASMVTEAFAQCL